MIRFIQAAFIAGICLAALASTTPARAAPGGYPTLEVSGKIHLDYAFYFSDRLEFGDAGELRRAEFGFEGLLQEDIAYDVGLDFAGGEVEIKDALLIFMGLPRGRVRVGQFKQPLSLVTLTSSTYLTFIGTPLPATLATGRRLGVGYFIGSGAYTLAVSGYGQNLNYEGKEEGLGVGARLTFAPINRPKRVLHFGIAAAWEQAPDAADTVAFSARPEAHTTDIRLVRTGPITGVDSLKRFGLEAAGVWGPFSLQGEILRVNVSRRTGPDVTAQGWYLFASYFLTGESRPYDQGVFGRVHPIADTGAWEIALRYSSLDLSDGAMRGGEEQNITLGLNYYLTSHLKFQMNYTRVDSQRRGFSADPAILQFRVAFDF